MTERSYTDALIAIASVSAVLWTGGLIIRQLNPNPTILARVGMEYIAYSFFAPMFGLFISGSVLRYTLIPFAALYVWITVASLRYAARLESGKEAIPDSIADKTKYRRDVWTYAIASPLSVAAIILLIIWPSREPIAWSSVILDFLGYQFLLSDLNRPPGLTLEQRGLLTIATGVTAIYNRMTGASQSASLPIMTQPLGDYKLNADGTYSTKSGA